MRSASSYQPSSDRAPPLLKRRSTAFVLTALVHLLLLLLLLRLTPALPVVVKAPREPVAFQMLPDTKIAPEPSPRTKTVTVKHASGGASRRTPVQTPTPAAPQPTETPPPPKLLLGGKEMFDAADISKIASSASDGDSSGTGSGKDSGSAYGPGEGPGGQRLFNAEWYREPTHAELAGYLHNGAPKGSWAMIACKTIADYHVENCRALDESPIGSGLARSLREAAWQFRVRPPRIGGKPVIGAWVRIKFDWTDRPDN